MLILNREFHARTIWEYSAPFTESTESFELLLPRFATILNANIVEDYIFLSALVKPDCNYKKEPTKFRVYKVGSVIEYNVPDMVYIGCYNDLYLFEVLKKCC